MNGDDDLEIFTPDGFNEYWFLPEENYEPADATFVEYLDQPLIIAGDAEREDLEDRNGLRLPKQSGAARVLEAVLSEPKLAVGAALLFLGGIFFLKETV